MPLKTHPGSPSVRLMAVGLPAAWLIAGATTGSLAQFDPPAGFYDAATGTGATLKNQLSTLMATGHIQRTYGDFRFAAALIDQDPSNPSNILEVYNRASVPGAWDCPNGNCVWNREHVWPQSLQPGSASNSSTGNLGDHHVLRPADPGVNSDRGNKPFGNFDTTGVFGSQGTFYFPGDADKGDVARNLFYSATRYQSTGLVLVNGVPTGNQMGDLQSLLRWHYTDPPDDFERRRNHVIFSSSLNPSFFTNNRNAYIDRPEFVWSVFGGGANDSMLFVGGGAAADGSSSIQLDLGRIIVGGPLPAAQSVIVSKVGADPTYYAMTPSGSATSIPEGPFNAFDFDPQSDSIEVGLSGSTAAAGLQSGTVTIDNLDVDGGGAGQGSDDGDDTITVELTVLDHAEASFDSMLDQDGLTLDFGTILDGGGLRSQPFVIHNLEAAAGFTARLDLDAVTGTGETATLFTDLSPFNDLEPGASNGFTAFFDTDAIGAFAAQYTLAFSDEGLPGAVVGTDLILTLTGEVLSLCDACDVDCDGLQTTSDIAALLDLLIGGAGPCSTCAGDLNQDTIGDAGDIQDFVNCLLTGP